MSGLPSRLRWVTLVAAVALAANTAHADDPGRRAVELFKQSEVAYEQGRFADAVTMLREAYSLKKEPVLLYNLGRAYEGLADHQHAIVAYREFLAAEPNTSDRGAIEARIAIMQRQLDERRALDSRERQRPSPENGHDGKSPVPWVVAGIGGALLVTGAVVGGIALSKHDAALDEPSHARATDLESTSHDLALWSNVSLVAGGVLVVAGVVWAVAQRSPSRTSLVPIVRF